jgi:hypothetical protein
MRVIDCHLSIVAAVGVGMFAVRGTDWMVILMTCTALLHTDPGPAPLV